MGDVLISVVTTCYNQQGRIPDTIKSVAIQDYPFWELVIVDDCSTDKSLKAIKKCVRKLGIADKVKVLSHDKNTGCGRSLRDAIENTSGDLIAVVDGDDALATKKALRKMVKVHMKHPDVALVYSNYTECSVKLKPMKVYKTRQLEEGKTYLGTKIRISHLKCFKRSFYNMTEGVNPRLRQTVDKDLVLKLEEVGKLLYLDENLYYYREHRHNLTKSYMRKSKDYRVLVIKERLELYAEARSRRGLPPKPLIEVEEKKKKKKHHGRK